jgi:tRNA G18 (ribose-2'-O)-methylase SpoU
VSVGVDDAEDPRLEPYRHVADHQWLRRHGLFVAEGRLVLQRLVAARSYRLHSVLLSPAALAAMDESLRGIEAPIYVASQAVLNETAGVKFHRGCLALVARPEPLGPDVLHGSRLLLGLEAVGNPDNVGGLFRTAAAFGVEAVLLDDATGDPLYRKAIRTSMGAALQVPFVRVASWLAIIRTLRSDGFSVIALTPEPSATTLDEYAARSHRNDRLLLMVGTEGSGLSKSVVDIADATVRIPVASGVDSLNVTVAAGVALSRLAGR